MRVSALAMLAAGVLLVSGCAGDNALGGASQAADVISKTASRADNFMLVDQNLEAHELYRMRDASVIVLVSQKNGDAVIRAQVPRLAAIAANPAAKVMLVNSELSDNRDAIVKEAKVLGGSLPILLDDNQLVGESLGVSRSAEAFLIDPKTWKIFYHGDVAGAQTAIEAFLAGGPAPATVNASLGAPISFPERQRAATLVNISYSEVIAPMLEKRCVECHQQGGIAPFAMDNYDIVKNFSPMIREAIRTDRMPPYNADSHVGAFKDPANLTPVETRALVHWIEAGAPRGAGPDPLAAVKRVAPEWPFGKPDLIVDVPTYKIPASGVIDYQFPVIPSTLKEGHWIRATAMMPGDRRAVHHITVDWRPPNGTPGPGKLIAGFAPGAGITKWEADTGMYLPAGGSHAFVMHYTPYGKETSDTSKLGLYFADKAPTYIMHNVAIADMTIDIPANTPRHKEVASLEFPNDALLYGAMPHAHNRGFSNDLWIYYPNGEKKQLLSMPRYDFAWQRFYDFETPIPVPAGSRLVVNYTFDNSKENPLNPDHNARVVWGEQSFEEMLGTFVNYRWMDETAAKPVDDAGRISQGMMLGMMDDNLDNQLDRSELRGGMGKMLEASWTKIDTNGDGALQNAELKAGQQYLRMGRGGPPPATTGSAVLNGPAPAGGQ